MKNRQFKEDFTGKIIIVTGGNGQIGVEIISSYIEAGAIVINLDLNNPEKDWQDLTSDTNGVQYYIGCDITDKSNVVNAINEVISKFGAIDILVNSAGISVFTPFEERTVEEFESVVNVNMKGMFLMSQCVIEHMKKQKDRGVVLNIGSMYGHSVADQRIYGDSGRNSPEVYAMTKAGVNHFTSYLGRYFAKDGIRVNCISPGGIFDNQAEFFVKNYEHKTPMGRMGHADDLIGGVFYLTSSMSEYVTGQNIIIDGGFTLGG